MKDGGVIEQRGSLVLYTCTESGLGVWDLCVCDKDTVGTLKETAERT